MGLFHPEELPWGRAGNGCQGAGCYQGRAPEKCDCQPEAAHAATAVGQDEWTPMTWGELVWFVGPPLATLGLIAAALVFGWFRA
jgi:hypothetical protein